MPNERSQQLVYQLDAWYRSHDVRQKDLAAALNMTPQQLSEVLAQRNRPTAAQILAILSFLENENMQPESVLPPSAAETPRKHTVVARRVVSPALAALIKKRGGVPKAKTATPTPAKSKLRVVPPSAPELWQSNPARLKVPAPIEEPLPSFTPTSLLFFNLACHALQRTDIRENQALLLAHHYLQKSGDEWIAAINPDELLSEIKTLKTKP